MTLSLIADLSPKLGRVRLGKEPDLSFRPLRVHACVCGEQCCMGRWPCHGGKGSACHDKDGCFSLRQSQQNVV